MTASMMFVPASAPDKYRKALATEAAALIVDLEDSVAPGAKAAARASLPALLAGPRDKPVWVRVNDLSSGMLLDDLVSAVPARPFGIVVPKCCGRESLLPVAHYLDALEAANGLPQGQIKILAIATETARSLFHLHEYVGSTPRLWGLAWGAEDLAADVGSFSNSEGSVYTAPYQQVRSMCLLAAAAAGVRPIDAVCVSIQDVDRVAREARDACRDGFVGKMAIHPAQLAPINAAFTYSDAQREWARRVVAAFAAAPDSGAVSLDGKMIDRPHMRLAQRVLNEEA